MANCPVILLDVSPKFVPYNATPDITKQVPRMILYVQTPCARTNVRQQRKHVLELFPSGEIKLVRVLQGRMIVPGKNIVWNHGLVVH
jgi:hypothetical protein